MESLFGTDGVRGCAGVFPLTRLFIQHLGVTVAQVLKTWVREHRWLGRQSFLIIRDTRSSGSWLSEALSHGVRQGGLSVFQAGVLPTPAAAHLVRKYKCLGAAVVSASHNPPVYNGIKFFFHQGEKFPKSLEEFIESHLHSGFISKKAENVKSTHAPEGHGLCPWVKNPRCGVPPHARALGSTGTTKNVRAIAQEDYLRFLLGTLPKGFSWEDLHFGVDCAQGAASRVAPRLMKEAQVDATFLSIKPNGKNINLGCGSQHPGRLKKWITRTGAQGGVALDGDADRALFIDEKRRILTGDHILALVVWNRLQGGSWGKKPIVLTTMSNGGIRSFLRTHQVPFVETQVGDRFVYEAMKESGALLGGEPSGHVIFREHLNTGDGLLTTLQVLAIWKTIDQPLSWVRELFPIFPQILINIPVEEKRPIESCDGFLAKVEHTKKVIGPEGRVIVRYSGTEPLLRIMVEGPVGTPVEKLAQSLAATARKSLQK